MLNKEPRKLKRAVVKEELVALTGKPNYAMVLNQFIYWSERVKDADTFLKEEMTRVRKFSDGSVESTEDIKENLQNGWIYKKAEDLIDETMLECSTTTMERICKLLVENGWLKRRRNPKFKWDKTWQYRVDLQLIQKDLQKLGYSLEGYSLFIAEEVSAPSKLQNEGSTDKDETAPNLQIEDSKLQNEASNLRNEDSKLQNEASNLRNEVSNPQNEVSKLQNEVAIPEITTDITSKIIQENTSDTSIYDELLSSNIDLEVKKILIAHIDRLIDRNISLSDIESHYKIYSAILPETMYASCIEKALQSDKLKANFNHELDALIKHSLQALSVSPIQPQRDMTNQIDNSLLPLVIKKVLFRYVNRLMTESISISSIENHFNSHKDLITAVQYAEVVEFVLEKTSTPIRSITATLNTGVSNKLRNLEKLRESTTKQKKVNFVREEKKPSWLDEDEEPKKLTSDSEVSKDEFEAQKQMLMSTLKSIGNGSKSILEKQKKKA
ncbi:hypothetical protein P8807_08425 [Bacillus subtilis]|uniref:hypothetical protein n=1 Tax=Bacillus subtilis group TaxID=653685 RepID=UPI000CE06E0F|nr:MULTISPECIES: hypothetical protein [Bacillus subtilis group]AVB12092.1 hypothetical protein C3438_21770 [Bacillus velezensis]AYK76592.1 hypothetical protein D9C12_22880 [Bacillus subtilis subsp. subtilis]AYL03222.1 hypothetical protein D9C08_23035 [Bacillus subtilis subsp. subtilis]MCT6515303.1 hypothetical protein [Bacillus subtilis]MEC0326653.1 hypothetical protein [Bacillus subtilis]